jgi:hypothetical protein
MWITNEIDRGFIKRIPKVLTLLDDRALVLSTDLYA